MLGLDQEIVLWIVLLPASIVPAGRVARCRSLRLQAALAHVDCNVLNLLLEARLNAGHQLVQMQMAFAVDNVHLGKHAGHVALELLVGWSVRHVAVGLDGIF